MSIELSPADFMKHCSRVMQMVPPANYRSLGAWLGDWKEATEKMKYLKVERFGISDSLRYQIRIRGMLKRPHFQLDFIRPDVVALWTQISEQAEESIYSFSNVENGFECSFMAVAANSYVTGSIVVHKFIAEDNKKN